MRTPETPSHSTIPVPPAICRRALRTVLLLMLLVTPPCSMHAAMVQADETPAPQSVWTSVLDVHQTFISRADGDRCPMVPSCSQYARQALREHGTVKGWILVCDRLLRCGRDESRLAPAVPIEGSTRIFDPLGANTFWWEQR